LGAFFLANKIITNSWKREDEKRRRIEIAVGEETNKA
jgi:hypothetical protein